MVVLATCTELVVIDPGPAAALHRMLCPLVERLSQKLRTGSPELNDSGPTTGNGHWRYAGGALHFMRILVTLTTSHRRQQSRRHHQSCARQGLSYLPTGMPMAGFSNSRIELFDARLHLLQ